MLFDLPTTGGRVSPSRVLLCFVVLRRHCAVSCVSLTSYFCKRYNFISTHMSREGKRTAESPLSDDGYEKRQCDSAEHNSVLATDSNLTIIDPEFQSSTVLDNPAPEMASGSDRGRSIKEDLKAAICDLDVLKLVSKAVAAQVSSQLRKEIAGLWDKVAEKDREILFLKDQIDSLEQYSRRNCLCISPVPEVSTESTDDIVKTVAKTVGVTLPDDAIDRSNRVGKVAAGGLNRDRPILVKFTSYKYKAMMKARRGLNKMDATKIFPDSQWPALTARSYCSRTQAVHQRGPDLDESRGGSRGQTAET